MKVKTPIEWNRAFDYPYSPGETEPSTTPTPQGKRLPYHMSRLLTLVTLVAVCLYFGAAAEHYTFCEMGVTPTELGHDNVIDVYIEETPVFGTVFGPVFGIFDLYHTGVAFFDRYVFI